MYNIKELRKQKGWTQSELGKKFNSPKNPETICRWEKGKAVPTTSNLFELANIFNVSVEKFFKL